MKILTLIKQVPFSSDLEVDEKTGVIKRESGAAKMNPYDLYALETALRLKKKTGGSVTVLTMGPPQAEQVIREAFMMGADEGYMLTDRAFAGSDVLATSRALSQGIIAAGNFALIISGKQTTDGDTAQVASEISEFLNCPCITNVTAIDAISAESISLTSDMGQRVEKVELPFPSVISVEKGIHQPRLPSYIKKKETKDKIIHHLSLANLSDQNPDHYGLDGSPTQVVRIFPPASNQSHERWEGTSKESAEKLFHMLKTEKYIEVVL